ncbi:MAG TPA: M2 family metallopeptidase [Bryobacteraceae bacterium]|nr:M2 family metallopeptidase [Bryobacteraceae bacterium]
MRLFFVLGLAIAIKVEAQAPAKRVTQAKPAVKAAPKPAATTAKPSIGEVREWMDAAEKKLLDVGVESGRADWIAATYIIEDSEILSAQANQRAIAATIDLVKDSARFKDLPLPEDIDRKMKLLKLSLTLPAPSDPKEAEELTRIKSGMEGTYGKGKYCPEKAPEGDTNKDGCLDLTEITRIMATSRNDAQLLEVWDGWHKISRPMRKPFQRYVELANKGAREIGFKDVGAMWREKYDMAPDAFAKELDRLWEQVKPLYVSLHAYMRTKLIEQYGERVVNSKGPIPAHLLGNMWAQSWENLYPVVAPPNADPGFDLTEILKRKKIDEKEMVRYGERFFTSIGFDPLPKTFWDRSLFIKPQDRDVVCHASAWNVDYVDDLRIKMCIDITAEDFNTIHHELGHNFYQRAYNKQPVLFRDSANDGFHEAIGDAVALSITPDYLQKIGLLDRVPPPSKDIGLLLSKALEKIAFLPFGLLIDQWRWKVFSGEITPENYNKAWWDLKLKYQGVAPPNQRSEEDFDPGAKYHVPANVPYTRYFLAHILQFQFHRALAKEAGCSEPLNRCSVYDSKPAGEKLKAMLQMGMSRPWPNALKALTGQSEMDATAIRDYFAPLQKWLDEQNAGKPVGW